MLIYEFKTFFNNLHSGRKLLDTPMIPLPSIQHQLSSAAVPSVHEHLVMYYKHSLI